MASPGDQREDHAEAVAAAIAAIYQQAELVIIAAVAYFARKAATGALLPAVAERKLQQAITAVYEQVRPKVEAELGAAVKDLQAVPQAALGPSLPQAQGMPSPAGGTQAGDLSPLADSIEAAQDTAQQSAASALSDAVTAADAVAPGPAPGIYRGTADAYRYAVQGAIEDRGGMPGASLSLSRIQAAQQALDDLTAHGITGFTDAAGRNWDLATYVEMATRTAVSNAWDDLQAAAMQRSGLDLIETYTHSTEGSCPLCIPWLGRTLSLTGATPGYPTLVEAKAAGFRHPRCRCSWVPLGAGVMAEVTNPVPTGEAAAAYEASQKQRALERDVRRAGRRAHAAITTQERTRARRELAAARAASEHHRQQAGVVMTKVSAARREHPFNAH